MPHTLSRTSRGAVYSLWEEDEDYEFNPEIPDGCVLNLSTLTPVQQEFQAVIKSREFKRLIAVGTTRQAKTAGMDIGMVELSLYNIANNIGNNKYLLGGPTVGSIEANSADYINDVCKQFELTFKQSGNHWYINDVIDFRIAGGEKRGSHRPIRGDTLHSAFIDEFYLCDSVYIYTVWTRLSFDDSLLMMASNHDEPYHPLRDRYVNYANESSYLVEIKGRVNSYHSKTQWEEMVNDPYQDHMYKRMIKGEYAAAGGLVIPIEPFMVYSDPNPPNEGIPVCDGGTAGTTAATLWVPAPHGHNIVDEYDWDAHDRGRISDGQHADNLLLRWRFNTAVVDPNAVGLQTALQDRGVHVIPAHANHRDTVQSTNNALRRGFIRINEATCRITLGQCAHITFKEFSDEWEKAYDHEFDTVRYGGHHFYPFRRGGIYGASSY